MKIDRILCLNDSELYWTGSFTGKILTKQKWLLTKLKTQSCLEVVCGLKCISRLMPENIFMLNSGEKNVLTLSKVYFSNKMV